MRQPKKDESVKTGLKIESNEDLAGKEKDPDELVHEQPPAEPTELSTERDMDELVHELPSTLSEDSLREKDPDDLVHENIDPDEEQV